VLKIIRWLLSGVVLLGTLSLIIFYPLPFLFYQKLPHIPFMGRALYILLLASLLCLYRVVRGPSPADRIMAIDIMGIVIIGLCAILTITTGRNWYMDVGIAWALQSFITVLALSKHLEGKNLDA
jgi:multicomponent Na+:H+ antiporter subunit F